MSHQPVRLPSELAKLLRSERVFLAARDVAEIEYRKHADAGVSVGGSVTAATRAALDVAISAIYDGIGADAGGSGVAARIDALTGDDLLAIAHAVQQAGGTMMQWPSVLRDELRARLLREEQPK